MGRETVSNPGYYPYMHMVKKILTACFVLCVLLPHPYLSCKKANAVLTQSIHNPSYVRVVYTPCKMVFAISGFKHTVPYSSCLLFVKD